MDNTFYRVWYAQFYDGKHAGTGRSSQVYAKKENAVKSIPRFARSGGRYQTVCIVAGANDEDNPFTENGKLKTIPVCVYRDTTPFYTKEECDVDNLCSMEFPKHIVQAWYGKTNGFDEWLDSYTADETVGLFDFSKGFGFDPVATANN